MSEKNEDFAKLTEPRLLDQGSWTQGTSAHYSGGQLMRYQLHNANVLGVTITIDSNIGGSHSLIIPPLMTLPMDFTCFGMEPLGWRFDISTESDAFVVTWKLYSTWIPGDPESKEASRSPKE